MRTGATLHHAAKPRQASKVLQRVSYGVMAAGLCLSLASCANYGARSIQRQRGPYTEVLAATDKEELLSNIVRLAYTDPPVFLQVHSVTATPSFEYGTESELKFDDSLVPPPAFNLKPKMLVKEAPTSSYKPLLGREFSHEMLMPFGIRPVFLMLDNGFDFSVVAQLLFKSVNGLNNSRDASVAERLEFRQVMEALSRLIKRGDVKIGTPPEGLKGTDATLFFEIPAGVLSEGEGAFVASKLGWDPAVTHFEMRAGLGLGRDSLLVRTRSLLSLLSYMSNYVDVPPGDEALLWPSEARKESEPLMRIHSSTTYPTDGDPVVLLRGHWFYLRADDLRSRNFLFLLRLLFNLQAQATNANDDVQLTLPLR